MKTSVLFIAIIISSNLIAQDNSHDEVIIYRDGIQSNMLLGGSGAHGGDHRELSIQNLGWTILDSIDATVHPLPFELDVFVEKLRNLKVEIVDSIELNGSSRTAINIPDQSKIILSKNSYDYLRLDTTEFSEKAHFFLHEFLPLIGIDDSGYSVSRQIVQNNIDQMRHGYGSRVLYQQNFNHRSGGTSFREAQNICESFKRRFMPTYFSVYCLYQEKITATYVSFDHFSIHHNSLYNNGLRSLPSYNYYSFETVYGLRVVGFGLLSQLQELRLVDSEVTDMPTYRTASIARFRCIEMIAKLDDYDFNFYRARCETVKVDNGYKFNILTKNPLLQ